MERRAPTVTDTSASAAWGPAARSLRHGRMNNPPRTVFPGITGGSVSERLLQRGTRIHTPPVRAAGNDTRGRGRPPRVPLPAAVVSLLRRALKRAGSRRGPERGTLPATPGRPPSRGRGASHLLSAPAGSGGGMGAAPAPAPAPDEPRLSPAPPPPAAGCRGDGAASRPQGAPWRAGRCGVRRVPPPAGCLVSEVLPAGMRGRRRL